uniref:Uncharacterized protein n=1 Tax=Anguilla anguilla TaxID=7936 RepID=A0A0E9URG0_ANGAN
MEMRNRVSERLSGKE